MGVADKSGITAHSYGSRSSAPLINTALSGASCSHSSIEAYTICHVS